MYKRKVKRPHGKLLTSNSLTDESYFWLVLVPILLCFLAEGPFGRGRWLAQLGPDLKSRYTLFPLETINDSNQLTEHQHALSKTPTANALDHKFMMWFEM